MQGKICWLTNLEEIELEHRLAREAKAAGEKIKAALEEWPYRANAAQGQWRSDLMLSVRLGEGI